MHWNNCFSGDRFGDNRHQPVERTEYERDWDRLIFSSAFRRLQNKTQVFPLPEEVFVHNRLTHSLEVASVGRSLGKTVGAAIADLESVKDDPKAVDFYQNHLKNVISSACLAHDLGNPAFGHSGEEAISKFFRDKNQVDPTFKNQFSPAEWADLISFEGNANALRILTRRFLGRLPGGFRLTYSTLGAILKYPCNSLSALGKTGPTHRKKYGFFQAEKAVFEQIATKLGMLPDTENPGGYQRHPFVYLVEAADDICYNIIDFEDAHRLGIFSTDFVVNTLVELVCVNPAVSRENVKETVALLSEDANEVVSYLRAKSINYLARRCAEVFLANGNDILDGRFQGDLIGKITEAQSQLKLISEVSVKHIYNHQSVVRIELSGFRIMTGLVEDLVTAVLTPKPLRTKHEDKIIRLIPDQYMFSSSTSSYEKVMCVFDFISGMTDVYALKLYRNLRGIEVPSI